MGRMLAAVVLAIFFFNFSHRFRECVNKVVYPPVDATPLGGGSPTRKPTTKTTTTTKAPTVVGRINRTEIRNILSKDIASIIWCCRYSIVYFKLIESSTAATSTLDTTEEPTTTSTTTTTTTTTSRSRNRESFTDIVTRGNVGWVMEKQKNAYELGFHRKIQLLARHWTCEHPIWKYFVSIGVNTFQARMISNVQVEHNFQVDRNQNVIIGVKTFLQV